MGAIAVNRLEQLSLERRSRRHVERAPWRPQPLVFCTRWALWDRRSSPADS